MTFEEGLKSIFDHYHESCPQLEIETRKYQKWLLWDGKEVPIFPYRYYPKFKAMRDLPLLGDKCALSLYSVGNDSLEQILLRELDLAEYLLDSETDHITAYTKGESANIIAGMANGTTTHMQLHSSRFGSRKFHHELYTTQGTVSDLAVDAVVPQNALNIYTENGYEAFTDSDILLYGLTAEQQEEIYCIYDAVHDDVSALIRKEKRLSRIVGKVLGSTETIFVGEGS